MSGVDDTVLASQIAKASAAMARAEEDDPRNASAVAEWLRAIAYQIQLANQLAVKDRKRS